MAGYSGQPPRVWCCASRRDGVRHGDIDVSADIVDNRPVHGLGWQRRAR
jgi:hypothetical protein